MYLILKKPNIFAEKSFGVQIKNTNKNKLSLLFFTVSVKACFSIKKKKKKKKNTFGSVHENPKLKNVIIKLKSWKQN